MFSILGAQGLVAFCQFACVADSGNQGNADVCVQGSPASCFYYECLPSSGFLFSVSQYPSTDRVLSLLHYSKQLDKAFILFDVKDLKTYDNKQAAGLVSYALSRLERTSLGYDNTSEAFKNLGTIFGIKPNTIKNFRDSFDPFTDSDRIGWHQNETVRPHFINDILEYKKTLDQETDSRISQTI